MNNTILHLIKIDRKNQYFNEKSNLHYLIPWIAPVGKNYGSARASNKRAITAGLTFRELKKSIKETHDWWYSDALTVKRRNKFEKDPKEVLMNEKEILKKWNSLK